MWCDAKRERVLQRGARGRLTPLPRPIPLRLVPRKTGQTRQQQDRDCRQQKSQRSEPDPEETVLQTLLLPVENRCRWQHPHPTRVGHPGLETLVSQDQFTSFITSQTTLRTTMNVATVTHRRPGPLNGTQMRKQVLRQEKATSRTDHRQNTYDDGVGNVRGKGTSAPRLMRRGAREDPICSGGPIWRESSGETACFGRHRSALAHVAPPT
ncbi:hypothetical protein B0T11DRAFT_46716 [Plectosphaerella cucumerina]|uniref:Uncharacterized protein n=1 Tax=Plectosphaerella cucumerina TaxID=40658 RepID=A0A8K0X4F5_9PEZI|nr:hypothetical protein B0T11DRAFT_46716 [Plectosphaerella cucumerina]